MDRAAAFLNDSAKVDYTYAAQLPYLQVAMDEFQEYCEQNNIPTTNEESTAIILPINTLSIGFATTPALPSDLVEIQQIWERLSGSQEDYIPLTRVEFLPHYLENEQINELIYWAWEQQAAVFLGALTARDLKFDYVSSIFPTTVTSGTTLTTLNCKSFLAFRTAALCAEFIGENKTRADSLNQDAVLALDRSLGISSKGRQAIAYRHRPFRAAYRAKMVGF